MKRFLTELFRRREALSTLDKLMLDAVRSELNSNVLALWDRQVEAINKVQRLPEGMEVNFYRMVSGVVYFDAAIEFSNKTEELLIAAVRLNLVEARLCLVANIWAVRGYIFCIEYGGGSGYFDEALGMDPLPRFEVSCDLLADLQRSVGTDLA